MERLFGWIASVTEEHPEDSDKICDYSEAENIYGL